MALGPLYPCSYPGCAATSRKPGRCRRHEIARHRDVNARRPDSPRLYDLRSFRRARVQYLRAHPLCVICTEEGRLTPATQLDHVLPHNDDHELFWAEANWQGLCHSCHSLKTAQENGGFGNRAQWEELKLPTGLGKSRPQLTIVCGPPGAGKSTYVNEQREPDDIVIDFAEIKARVSHRPIYTPDNEWIGPALRERNRMLAALASSNAPAAWFITGSPGAYERSHWQRLLGGDVLVMATEAEECLRRIDDDAQRNVGVDWREPVAKWWRQFVPRWGDELIVGLCGPLHDAARTSVWTER